MFNGLSINPAYAGSQDFININGDVRKQWFGIKGAPATQTLTVHSPVFNDMFGLGVIVINDKVGVTNQQELSVSYSYKLNLVNQSLSFGLKGGFNSLRSNFDDLLLDQENDNNFETEKSKFVPVFGVGAYLKGSNYYVGLSIPQLYRYFQPVNKSEIIDVQKLCFLTGGYIFKINEEVKIKPGFLAKANFNSVFEMDLTTSMYYKENYIFGISYKSLNAVSLFFELGFDQKYFVGYSYDVATTRLIRHQYGTHEISFNIYLDRKGDAKVMNPRYF
jgi:type IX secretion system PorP/SprF family membrane protein